MRLRNKGVALLVPLLSAGLVLSACGGGSGGSGDNGGVKQGTQKTLPAADYNKTPYDQVKDGGTLRWGIEQYSVQWNYNQLNGPESATAAVMMGLMPQVFVSNPKGDILTNKDYLTSAKVTNKSPQTIKMEINKKAHWSDGSPITYNDFAAQWKAMNGTNQDYQVATTTGYESIKSVKEGTNPKEVILTFSKPFGEWKSLFSPLYPAKYMKTPELFNTSYKNKIPMTGGPYKVKKMDKAAQTITVVPDPKWWGRKPKLDKIVYKAMKIDAQVGAFANGELDYVNIGPNAGNLKRATARPDAAIEKAAGPDFRHITLNGKSDIFSNVKVRQAFALGMSRKAIAKTDFKGLGVPVSTMGNHFFVNTQKGYQDNSGQIGKRNPKKAKQLLKQAGWKKDGKFFKKDGKTLAVDFIIPSGLEIDVNEVKLVQSMEADIGFKVNIKQVNSNAYFHDFVKPGKFDATIFSWLGTPFPISSSKAIYQKPTNGNIRSNFARIGSDKIDSLMNKAAATVGNDKKARKLLNKADKLIWKEMHSVIIYQRPQIYATSKKVVNLGAFGLQQFADYTLIGFKK